MKNYYTNFMKKYIIYMYTFTHTKKIGIRFMQCDLVGHHACKVGRGSCGGLRAYGIVRLTVLWLRERDVMMDCSESDREDVMLAYLLGDSDDE